MGILCPKLVLKSLRSLVKCIAKCYVISMNTDQVFAQKRSRVIPFQFTQDVADVFDDMINRSVPFYREIHQLILDLVERYYNGHGKIYDLGCSTATTICLINQYLKQKNIQPYFVAVDNSSPMIEKAKEKCLAHQLNNVEFIEGKIEEISFESAEVVIMNYTLQFLPIQERATLLKNIYQSLKPGGILIISEKITSPLPEIQETITDLYYDFKKRNGYNEMEIAQKREALENVLIPISPDDQIEMFNQAGFEKSEMIFRWYNFASYIGVK
jgi:tRNA (cmo5U34)-methyltransferase